MVKLVKLHKVVELKTKQIRTIPSASSESIHSLSLRKHAYSNIQKISPPKTEIFQIKNPDIFHISAQNIDCGY